MTSTSSGTSQAQVDHDAEVLGRLAGPLDQLMQVTETPVTARRPWLQSWLRAHPELEPLVVTVHRDGELVAAAVLVRRPGRLWDDVLPAGAGESDEVRLPARDERAALELAHAVRDALQRLGRPWRLTLRDVPAGDLGVAALARLLPFSAVVQGNVSPRLWLGHGRELRAYVSRNHHQQGRRLRNRLEREGHAVDVAQLASREQVRALLPEIMRICRARDLEVRGESALDDPASCAFFVDALGVHADLGEVQLTALSIDGRLAAYVLNFVDGPAWRMWNCRFDPAWGSYGVGRLSHDAALGAALAGGAALYDWMRGEEPYKEGLSDHVHRAEDLHAASGRLLWLRWTAERRARAWARTVRDRSARLQAATARRGQVSRPQTDARPSR